MPSNHDGEWTMGELRRAIQRLEEAIKKHEESHVSLNRALLIVLLTALFNVGGALLATLFR